MHVACPCGDSSDAYCIREDGSGYCFGTCGGKNFPNKDQQKQKPKEEEDDLDAAPVQNITKAYVPHRGLTETTLRFYGIETKLADGKPFETAFPYPRKDTFKVKNFEDSGKMRSQGDMKDPDLFGMNLFDPGSKESITLTAGEHDAPSIWQATRGKTAAVSLPSGALHQAVKCAIKHRDYINSFKKIYLALDNDQNDQKTTQAISRMFDFNKVYLVKFNKHKDANEYAKAGQHEELFQVWNNAKRYSPDNIISSFADIEEALKESKEDQIGTWPFRDLNDALFGIRRGDVITIFAVPPKVGQNSSGSGKTEFFRATEHHLLKTTNRNIGIIHLEEDSATTVKAIAGYELDMPATLPTCGLSTQDILDGYKKAVGGRDDRVHLYTSFELQDEEILFDNIRFLATAAQCDFIFLDHITWLATGNSDEDQRLKLDRISQKLKLLAKELRVAIIMISHTNDEGRTRGSRNIENVSNVMIKLVRDKEAADENERATVAIHIPKARLGGMTGPAGFAKMNMYSRKLEDLQPAWAKDRMEL